MLLLLLLLLSYYSCVWLCATPETAAHQAPPSLGFSRQDWWPFPSPMHESEKGKWGHRVLSDSSWPHGLQPTRLLRLWDFPGKSTGVGCHCLAQLQMKSHHMNRESVWTKLSQESKESLGVVVGIQHISTLCFAYKWHTQKRLSFAAGTVSCLLSMSPHLILII